MSIISRFSIASHFLGFSKFLKRRRGRFKVIDDFILADSFAIASATIHGRLSAIATFARNAVPFSFMACVYASTPGTPKKLLNATFRGLA